MDLGGHMEDRQGESLCAPVPHEEPGPHSEAGTRYQRKPKGGYVQADGVVG